MIQSDAVTWLQGGGWSLNHGNVKHSLSYEAVFDRINKHVWQVETRWKSSPAKFWRVLWDDDVFMVWVQLLPWHMKPFQIQFKHKTKHFWIAMFLDHSEITALGLC